MDKKEKPPENPPAQDTAEGPTEHVGAGTVRATDAEHKGTDRWTTTGVQQDTIRQGRQLPAVPGQTQQPTGSREAPPIKPPLFQVITLKKVHLPAKPGSSDSDKAQTASDKGNSTTSTTDIVGQTATNKGTRTRDDNTENIFMSGQGSEARQNTYKSNLASKTFVSERRNVFTDQSADHQKQDKPHDKVEHQGDRGEHPKSKDKDRQSSVITAGDQDRTPKQDKTEVTVVHTDDMNERPDTQDRETQPSGHISTREVTTHKQGLPKPTPSTGEPTLSKETQRSLKKSGNSPLSFAGKNKLEGTSTHTDDTDERLERQPSGHISNRDNKDINPKQAKAADTCFPMRDRMSKQQQERNQDSSEPLEDSVKQAEDPPSEPSVPKDTPSDTKPDIDKGNGEDEGNAEFGDGDKGTHASSDPVTGSNNESVECEIADAIDNNKDEADVVETEETQDLSDSSYEMVNEEPEDKRDHNKEESGAASIEPPIQCMVSGLNERGEVNSGLEKQGSAMEVKVQKVGKRWLLTVNGNNKVLSPDIEEARYANGFLALDGNDIYEINLLDGDIVLKKVQPILQVDKSDNKQMELKTEKEITEPKLKPDVRPRNEVENETMAYLSKTKEKYSKDSSENVETGKKTEEKHLKNPENLKARSKFPSKDAAIGTEYDNENELKAMAKDVYNENRSRNSLPQDEDDAALTDMFSKIAINDSNDKGETGQGNYQKNQSEKQSKTDRSRDRNEDAMVNTSNVTAHGTYNMNESTSADECPQSASEINATENINQSTNDTNKPSTDSNKIKHRSGIRAKKYNEEDKKKVTDDPHEERQSGSTPPLPHKFHEPDKKQAPTDEPTPPPRKKHDKTSPTSQPKRSPGHGPTEVYRDASGDQATTMNSKGADKSIKSGQGQLTPGHVQPVVSETEGASSDLNRGASSPASIGEVIEKKLKCQISYNDNKEDVSLETDLETYMKLKYNLNNPNWLCQKQKNLNDQYRGMSIEYDRRTDVMIINLDVNKPARLQSSIVDNTVKVILQKTDHLFVNSLAIGGLDKIQVVEMINTHHLVKDKDLYVEYDKDLDYLHYVCPHNVRTLVDVLVQITVKQLLGPKKNIKFDMVYKEIFKKTSMVEKIKSENRPLQVSLRDENDDEFVCVLQGCKEDERWAANLINTEIVEGHGISIFAIKDIKHSDEFEISQLSDLVEETLQNNIDPNIVNHFNRNGTISICGPTQGNVDTYVTYIKHLLKSKTVSIENTDISHTQLDKYVKEVRTTIDKHIMITILGNDQYQVKMVGLKDTIDLVETRLLKKTNPEKDKATKFKVTESEKKIQTKENKGSDLTCEKKTIWIKDNDVFTHICAKEDLQQLAQMHQIQPGKLEMKKEKSSHGFCVTGGTHRYEALKKYLNQYVCEDLALSLNERDELPDVLHEVERNHNVTLKVEETPGPPEKEGATGGSTDATLMVEAVEGKEVDRTEWDFPGGHRLLVINDDANNCWQDLMVDINVGEKLKQSSEARVYETNQGKRKTTVHIMQWDGGEKKENDALLQEFERMLILTQTYDCENICIPIKPVGNWQFGKYIKKLLYAVNNHLKNKDMLKVTVQLCTTDVTLYTECCVAAKIFMPGSVETKKRKTKTNGKYHEANVKQQSIVVNVVKGQLDAIKADIIVNTTNHDLQLDYGAVSKSLLRKAGNELQQECNRNQSGKIKSGQIVVTKGYRLRCGHVFHSALDKYDGSAASIENLVMECMKKAGAMKCKSIAFPAIGTGNLSYPKHKVAAAMFDAVQRYEKSYSGSSVEQVNFVIYQGDQEAVTIFKEYQGKYNKQNGDSSTTYDQNESTTIRLGRINIKARLGTLDNCATEAIVYLWGKGEFHNAKFDEHRLLKEVGKDVKKTFVDHRKLDETLKYKVFSTPGGNIRFSVIVHAPCEDNKDSIAKALRDSLCLLDEEKIKTASVWFPAQHPFLKNGEKLPEVIVAAVKEVQQSVVCLSDICIVVEGKHNLPKIFKYFRTNGGKTNVTLKIIGKAGEIKLAKENLQHYTATGSFCNSVADDDTRLSPISTTTAPVEQIIDRGKEDSASGGPGKKSELLDMYVAIENIPQDYTLEKLRSALLVPGFPIAPPRFVYMDRSTDGIAICNSKEDASRLVKFKGIPGIRFKLHPKVLIEPTCTINCDKSNKQFILDQLKSIHVTFNEKSDSQLLIVAQTLYQIQLAKQICISTSASRERYHSGYEQIEPINVVSDIWEVVKIVKNENYKVLENNSNVRVEFKNNTVNVEWSGTVGDDDEIRNNVEVLHACCRSLLGKEIEEIQLDIYDEDKTQKWCNEVQATLDMKCCLHIPKQKKVFAYCDTYDDLQKVKHQFGIKEGKVKPTARKRRNMEEQSSASGHTDNSLAHTDDQSEFDGGKHNKRHKSDNRFSWTTDAMNVKTYETREGIIVKVYKASIVNLPVDCIVNAANDNLSHGGGIARVIEKAAGSKLTREGDKYVRESGRISVGLACTTTAGNLPYDCVIHAVGPRWSDYWPHDFKKVKEVEHDLHSAITNSFYEAEKRNLDSIAVPAISAAIFAVPEELCVYQYARAIVDYSRKSTTALRPLKEIHFIDINPSIIWKIQSMFKQMIEDGIQPNYDSNNFITSYQPASNLKWLNNDPKNKTVGNGRSNKKEEASSALGHSTFTDYTIENVPLITVSEENGVIIVKCGMTTLRLHEKGMFKVKANAIVSIESRYGSGSGTLASAIKNRIHNLSLKESFLNEKQKLFSSGKPLNLGDTPVSNWYGTNYNYVVHAVLPYSDILSETPDQRKRLIMKTYDNILAVVNNRDTTSIVMPLIGTGEVDKEIKCAAEAFVDSFTVFCNKRNTHTEKHLVVNLVLRTAKARKTVHTLFKDYAKVSTGRQFRHATPERPPLPSNSGRKKSTTEDTLVDTVKESGQNCFRINKAVSSPKPTKTTEVNNPKEKDNCVICMDDVSDPVTLDCGHVFCKDCIEQQFQHKKSCPTCGALCGIITGDQPSGTMDVTTSHVFDCAGYKGGGRIVIQYDFPSGYQQPNHPSPGTNYKGIKRTAYLPDNHEGREICEMLRVAFERKLVFTIGSSRTTGQEGVITWNDIHHKTDYRPNTQFGYPDPTYLVRVKDELAAKGVTEKDIPKQ